MMFRRKLGAIAAQSRALPRLAALLPSTLFLAVLTGCNVAYDLEEAATSANECQEDSDCGFGICDQGVCLATNTDLNSVLVEVTPAASTQKIAGVRFLLDRGQLEEAPTATESDALRSDVLIELPHVSQVSGTVSGADLRPSSCVDYVEAVADDVAPSQDGSLPVRVSLIPRERLLGLTNPAFVTEVDSGDQRSYSFELSASPGQYDLYVEPLAMAGDCVRPPYLVIDQEIAAGEVQVELELPEPSRLSLRVDWPDATTELDGWTVAVLERDSGRRLSNIVELSPDARIPGKSQYQIELAYSQVDGGDPDATVELIRLAPPETSVAPTLYFERRVVELLQDSVGVIDQIGALNAPVSLEGTVDFSQPEMMARAALSFSALSVEGVAPGTVASFERIVESDEQGRFRAELLPGTYRVLIEPSDPGFAQRELEFVVSSETAAQAVSFEVVPRARLTGSILSFTGDPAPGVKVEAISRTASSAYNSDDAGATSFARGRSVGVISEKDGRFEILVDPGEYDLVARTESGSDFAWAVHLGLSVSDADIGLGTLDLPLPIKFRGILDSLDVGSLPSAFVRVYAYLDQQRDVANFDEAVELVQVGEVRADEFGEFNLLLPSFLNSFADSP
ncbi:MAG: carboxypeptidase-like regulatory domain-containing protein [Polyangiaceae bacterium]|nr:carboxypeptidase-like regulatory domain-containing protein [Polyangiaceae bacterium]